MSSTKDVSEIGEQIVLPHTSEIDINQSNVIESKAIHISLKPDVIAHIGPLPITNTFFASTIVLIIFTGIAIWFKNNFKKNNPLSLLARYILKSVWSTFEPITKEKTDKYIVFLLSLFFFIIMNNWFGLLPFVGSLTLKGEHGAFPLLKGSTADLNTTLALSLTAVIYIQYQSLMALGVSGYIQRFINISNPMNFFIGILEIMEEFSKILSFAFRLFGNIFAGEVMLAVIAFLVPVLASFPFLVLEIFVGYVQALVFSMLVSVFLVSATAKHH